MKDMKNMCVTVRKNPEVLVIGLRLWLNYGIIVKLLDQR
jgi:hypothetical protein